MDLYTALTSGIPEEDLIKNFEAELAEARMKMQAERDKAKKQEDLEQKREALVDAMCAYTDLIAGANAIPSDIVKKIYKKGLIEAENKIKCSQTKVPCADEDTRILKAFFDKLY